MYGLLTKDFQLIAMRKQTLGLFFVICLVMGASMDGSFIISYMTFLSIMLSISTLTLDEAENGFSFLMTLPVTRRTYVLSKYIFTMLMGTASWLLSLVLYVIFNQVRHLQVNYSEDLFLAGTVLMIFLLVTDLMIPLQLKFGAEKSRLVLAICAGILVASVTALNVTSSALPTITPAVLFAVITVLAVIGTVVSLFIGFRLMEKKEL